MTASFDKEKAIDDIDPYFFIKVLFEIETIRDNLNGLENNSMMRLEKQNNSSTQNEFVFFQPDLLIEKCEFCYNTGVQIIKMKHVASEFPKEEDNDQQMMKEKIKNAKKEKI